MHSVNDNGTTLSPLDNNGDGCTPSPEHSTNQRRCIVCDRALSEARLSAMPTASKCVPCVQDSGDVPRIRRHDQIIGTLENQEVSSTYYKIPNAYLEKAIREENRRLMKTIAQ